MKKKRFHIAYDHSNGTSQRTVQATDEASAIEKAKDRVSRSGQHIDARAFRSVSRNKAITLTLQRGH
mgnify:CR=1 FL=1